MLKYIMESKNKCPIGRFLKKTGDCEPINKNNKSLKTLDLPTPISDPIEKDLDSVSKLRIENTYFIIIKIFVLSKILV